MRKLYIFYYIGIEKFFFPLYYKNWKNISETTRGKTLLKFGISKKEYLYRMIYINC